MANNISDKLTSIATAIRGKTGTTAKMSLCDMALAVDNIGAVNADDNIGGVNFVDYDGTILSRMTIADANTLAALPEAPVHPGLTFQCWNYTLAELHELEIPMEVGAVYITDDGSTRVTIAIAAPGFAINVGYMQTISAGVTVDFGDGTATATAQGVGAVQVKHTFSAAGEYTIRFKAKSGCTLCLGGGESGGYKSLVVNAQSNQHMNFIIKSAHLGADVCGVDPGSFYQAYGLKSITLPNNVLSIGTEAFASCGIYHVVVPPQCAIIDRSAFSATRSMRRIATPNSVKTVAENALLSSGLHSVRLSDKTEVLGTGALGRGTNAQLVTIPKSAKSITGNAFNGSVFVLRLVVRSVPATAPSTMLSGIFIRSLEFADGITAIPASYAQSARPESVTFPNSLTTIETQAFYYCSSLASVTFPNSLTTIGSSAFGSCSSLASVTFGNSLTTIETQAFYYCSSLASVTFGNSLTTIGSSAFGSCSSLASVTFPNSLTTIGSSAFGSCYGLDEYRLLGKTPPALASSGALQTSSRTKIYVPHGCLAAYKAATNWAALAQYMVEDPA